MTECTCKPPKIRTWKTALIDQGAHMFYASCLWLGFMYAKEPWVVTLLVMAVAFVRELEQKDWDVTRVGLTDLFFFFITCISFDIWYYFFR